MHKSILANANRATVLVHGRNELHLKFNNDADLRAAYAELNGIAARRALTDAQLIEHLHARGWRVEPSDVPMIREAAAALAVEPVTQEWRAEAAAWLRAKADEQEATNRECPRHAEAYPSWGFRVRDRRWLADELLAAPAVETVAVQAEPVDEYDRLKAQKDRLLQREREKHCKCDECGKAKSAGWALYCVECSGKFYATPSQPVGTLTDERIEFGLNCNLEDPSDDESNGFYAGVKFAEHAHGILAATAEPAAPVAAQPAVETVAVQEATPTDFAAWLLGAYQGAIINEQLMADAIAEYTGECGETPLPVAPKAEPANRIGKYKRLISQTIGYEWEPGELQTVNADDLLRLIDALATPQAASAQPVVADTLTEEKIKAFNEGREYEAERLAANRAIPAEQAAPTEPRLIEWEDAHETAWQAAAAFRPSYFGDNFIAHNWVVEAVRSAHIDGQRFARGLPKINRARGGELPHELRQMRVAADRSTEAARLVYALCEDIEATLRADTDFDRGMRTAAKRIRKEVLAAMGTPAAAEPDSNFPPPPKG